MVNGLVLDQISFKIGTFSIENLSFKVEQNEYFILTGPNGAGKTILIKLIAGLYYPLSGTIFINGQLIIDLPPWKRNIGYIPQDGVLFTNRTVKENIQFGLEIRRIKSKEIMVKQIAEMMKIEHLLNRMPQNLSGGERQKVSLARVLVLTPSILLLDEPVSAIDEEMRDEICKDLKTIQQQNKIPIIHISHNQQEINLVADKIGFLNNGKLQKIINKNGSI